MDNKIHVVNWNISYMGDYKSKLDFLFSLLHDNYCVLLQEVKPHVCVRFSAFQKAFCGCIREFLPPHQAQSS